MMVTTAYILWYCWYMYVQILFLWQKSLIKCTSDPKLLWNHWLDTNFHESYQTMKNLIRRRQVSKPWIQMSEKLSFSIEQPIFIPTKINIIFI